MAVVRFPTQSNLKTYRITAAIAVAFLIAAIPLRAESEAAFPILKPRTSEGGIRWRSLIQESLILTALQHAGRVASEDDTRAGLGGRFFPGWGRSVANLHGWADGDPFMVNYIGHPAEGAAAGFLFVRNDPKYQRVEFGRNRDYWRSRLRAAAWSWVYSTQFEIGPLSEATIGKVQSWFPQQGFVDQVITPSFGLGWMIAEDAIDKYVIKKLEARTTNKAIRIFARGVLNPSRSTGNFLSGNVPWHRDTRAGVTEYRADVDPENVFSSPAVSNWDPETRPYAPFELSVQYDYSQVGSAGQSCNGGSGNALFNITPHLGIEAEVGGCKVASPEANTSGDSTTYLAGMRYTWRNGGRWSPFVHLLAGGEKLTREVINPDLVVDISKLPRLQAADVRARYASEVDSNQAAVQVGGGVNYELNRALALRVGDLEYLHTYGVDLNNRSARGNFRFSTGFTLRMGNW